MVERVDRYKDRPPLMEAFGVEQEIQSTLNRRVDLPSGGYLIFDYAEAFTVIDVNTGRFVGSRSKSSPGRLEDTITKNNLEAVKEVVRQLRLRDVGGIIVIDFIDMANPKNRAAVEEALRHELERDRTKTYVVEISPLGLVEMTRQNVTDGPREVMTRKCPTCGGDGIVVSEATTALEIERKLRALVTPGVAREGLQGRAEREDRGARRRARRPRGCASSRRRRSGGSSSSAATSSTSTTSACSSRARSRSSRPAAPVEVGQELELKLGEVGLHDPRGGRREARRDRRHGRRRGEARRQEGARARDRGDGGRRVRRARRPRRRAGAADHRRGGGREADARAAPRRSEADRSGDEEPATSSSSSRRRAKPSSRAARPTPTPRAEAESADGEACGREEADAPRHARRAEPSQEGACGRGRGRLTTRTRPRTPSRRRRNPRRSRRSRPRASACPDR